MHTISLDNGWLAHERTDELSTTYWRSDLDHRSWLPVQMPSQWAVTPGLEACRGPVAYRNVFPLPRIGAQDRARVRAGGVFYYGHYWLDDIYLGDRHGYFGAHELDCTEVLREREEHTLAVEVECPDQADPTAKTIVTGVFSHWDAIATGFNPGGFWKPVEIRVTGPAYLTHTLVLTESVSPVAATVRVRLAADSEGDRDARVRVRLVEEDSGAVADALDRDWALADGANTTEFPMSVPQPRLWWPHRLGEQPMYRLEVELCGPDGDVWDAATRTTGMRSVRVEDWTFTVNGERLFIRGANHAPTRMAMCTISPQDAEADVALAVAANLDLLRLHAHVAPASMYAAADRAGLLLWQDFPLQWGYSRRIRKDAVQQARDLVRLVGHHPSVAMWCCHNEPLAVEITDTATMTPFQVVKVLGSMFAPTWNKDRLDPALRRAFEDEDPSRFVDEKSGEMPGPISKGTDTHVYWGWYMGAMRTFGRLSRYFPRLYRFVSEFGAQALPSPKLLGEMDAGTWPELRWHHLEEHHSAQPALLQRFTPTRAHDSLESYVEATQRYQADLLRFHIEVLRRLKYRPCGGFAMFQFADSYPAVTWSVLDVDREPKLGYDVLRRACADVVAIAEWPAAVYQAGEMVTLALHVVSELRRPLHDLRLTARLGDEVQEWEGDVEADGVAGCGELRVAAPGAAGTHVLELTLADPDGETLARSSYEIVVA